MNSDKHNYSDYDPEQDYSADRTANAWGDSGSRSQAIKKAPEQDEFTKMSQKVVLYGTAIAIAAISVFNLVAPKLNDDGAATAVEVSHDQTDEDKAEPADHTEIVIIDRTAAQKVNHTFEKHPN